MIQNAFLRYLYQDLRIHLVGNVRDRTVQRVPRDERQRDRAELFQGRNRSAGEADVAGVLGRTPEIPRRDRDTVASLDAGSAFPPAHSAPFAASCRSYSWIVTPRELS